MSTTVDSTADFSDARRPREIEWMMFLLLVTLPLLIVGIVTGLIHVQSPPALAIGATSLICAMACLTTRWKSQRTHRLQGDRSEWGTGTQENTVSEIWNRTSTPESDIALADILERRIADSSGERDVVCWRGAFESLPDGVILSTMDDVVIELNRAAAALLDVPAVEEARTKPLTTLMGRVALHGLKAVVDRRSQGATSFVRELRRGKKTADGVFRICCSPLIDGHGMESGLVWTLRDVTQQKLAEEMRDQFVFTATHELRTPLANLKACAETLVLEEGIDIEQQKDFCNAIQAEASRLARFVDELLDISQMEGGAMTVSRHETDLERMLQEVTDHVGSQIRLKQQELEVVVPPKLPKLEADKDKLCAALINILGNACKYTPDGGSIRLEVEAAPEEIRIHVQDSGFGIAEAELPRIFDKFFRSDDDRVRGVTGSGLGLALANEVTRLHGGTLSVHSELNRGSRFSMTLPVTA